MHKLAIVLIAAAALWAGAADTARADVVLGPVNVPTCVAWRPGMPVYTPRCPSHTHYCRPGPPVYTPKCIPFAMPRHYPARRSTCLTPCGPCYMPCGGWCGGYAVSNRYPGPIRDFGGATRVRRWSKPGGRAVGGPYWCGLRGR